MSRNRQSYSKSLTEQANEHLRSMQRFGYSKHADKQSGADTRDYIYSHTYYANTKQQVGHYVDWLRHEHPDVTSMRKAKRYVPEYLQHRLDRGYAVTSIHTAEAALNKYYSIHPGDKYYYDAPRRSRADITRSRGNSLNDKLFAEDRHPELVAFCRATGLRRSELRALRGGDLYTREQITAIRIELAAVQRTPAQEIRYAMVCDALRIERDYYVHVVSGKGGRERFAPIIGAHSEQVILRMQAIKEVDHVWSHVPSHADIHAYRAEYATALYREYARDVVELSWRECYVCRGDQAGRRLDRRAIQLVSIALGHSREQVFPSNYLRGEF